MVDILTFLTNVVLIFCIEKLRQRKVGIEHHVRIERSYVGKRYEGLLKKLQIRAGVAEKFADRAFTMASTANLGVIALQKSLAVPKVLTKQQGQRNQLAKNEVDKLFTTEGSFDYMRPLLSDEENNLLDELELRKSKAATNGII